MIKIAGITIGNDEFDFQFVRSAGAGGQNVNKVASKAVLRWHFETSAIPLAVKERFRAKYTTRITLDGDVVITSDRYRDQPKNLADAVEKLKEMLESVVMPPKPRKKTKPSRGAVERRLQSKRIQSDRKRSRSGIDH